MKEQQTVHFALLLTAEMKRIAKKKSEDLFSLSDLIVYKLNLKSTSLAMLNLMETQKVLKYVLKVANDIRKEQQDPYCDITYRMLRKELMKRNRMNIEEVRQKWNLY